MARIQHVVILGGGSAGWMSAIYLNRLLAQKGALTTKVTLVESSDIGIVGVGESTFDQMRAFMVDMAIPEPDFLKATDATLKQGILFRHWQNGQDQYFHPFEFPQCGQESVLVDHWISLHAKGLQPGEIAACVGVQFALAKACRSPKLPDNKDYQGALNYAYHLDAVLLGQYLRKIAIKRGVEHRIAHCKQVRLNNSGAIEALILSGGEELQADFFIDCTGFTALLPAAMGNHAFVDYSDKLFCDRAVTARISVSQEDYQPRPYTTATAQENGWIWDIDLFHRKGCGYVYSSQHTTAARAETVLQQYLGETSSDIEFRQLKMRVGRMRNIWHKNCVAVGLSAGFIEPLESTGILFIDIGLRFLGELLPHDPEHCERQQQRYNHLMGELLDNTRDFILLHYLLTRREDSDFWRTYRHDMQATDRLKDMLELWRYKVPSKTDFSDAISTFSAPSHAFIMYGMGWQHADVPGSVSHLDNAFSRQLLDAMQRRQHTLLQQVPSHKSVLEALRARSAYC